MIDPPFLTVGVVRYAFLPNGKKYDRFKFPFLPRIVIGFPLPPVKSSSSNGETVIERKPVKSNP